VVIGPHTKCMTSMTSMTSTARVRARSRAPYIRKLFFLIFIFSKFQSVCPKELIQENRKMPSEWLGVNGGRSYGPVPRGKRLPGPAVSRYSKTYKSKYLFSSPADSNSHYRMTDCTRLGIMSKRKRADTTRTGSTAATSSSSPSRPSASSHNP
jgi:hypothetical protein